MAKNESTNTGACASSQSWRAQVATLLASAQYAMQEAMGVESDEGNGPYAYQLIADAHSLIEASAVKLQGKPNDYYGAVILPVQAMLMGARDMSDSHRAIPAMLEPAIVALEEAAHILDVAEVHDRGERATRTAQPLANAPNASPEPDTQAERPLQDFERRRGLACDAAGEVYSLAELVSEQIDMGGNGPALRSMLRRVMRLANIQLSALDDALESVGGIEARFHETEETIYG
jgi:hypothetical protein